MSEEALFASLEGRAAIITGASQGLGRAIAEAYVEAGASVMLCARDTASIEAVGRKLSARCRPGQKILTTATDVSKPNQVDALVAAAIRQFGKVHILVNNAGVYGPLGALEQIDWEDWVTAININLLGTVYPCRAILPHFKAAGYGKIINLSGGGATQPLPRLSAYATAKAGVVRFTETLSEEVGAWHIDVNVIAPGTLATRLLDEVVAAGPESVGDVLHARMVKIRNEGGTPLSLPAELCVYLGSAISDGLSGRLIAAVWDPWKTLHEHRRDLEGSDIYTLRRIVPKDRGQDWGGD